MNLLRYGITAATLVTVGIAATGCGGVRRSLSTGRVRCEQAREPR